MKNKSLSFHKIGYKKYIKCPACDDVGVLSSDLNDFYVTKIKSKIKVVFLSYCCDHCYESFTTTEVDEFNLSQINKGIRNFRRKIKIENIFK